jgi:hypothetical protein
MSERLDEAQKVKSKKKKRKETEIGFCPISNSS